jgi:hypothetical protein
MSEILTALEVDALTGIETIRELTADEIAEREAMAQAVQNAKQKHKPKPMPVHLHWQNSLILD